MAFFGVPASAETCYTDCAHYFSKEGSVSTSVKAVTYYAYDDIRIENRYIPTITSDELLVKVHGCGLCGSDILKIVQQIPPPVSLGHELTGTIVARGRNVTNFAVMTVEGTFHTFSGHVTVGDSLATSHLDATVDIQSIDTSSTKRDEHLRTADFFDVARFPQMTFTSTSLWGTSDSLGIKGNLTIKGVTKEVVFSGRILDTGLIVAEAKIDRTDFGITSGASIKNEVRLRLQIKVVKAPAVAP